MKKNKVMLKWIHGLSVILLGVSCFIILNSGLILFANADDNIEGYSTYNCSDKSGYNVEIKVKFLVKRNEYDIDWEYADIRTEARGLLLPLAVAASGSKYSNEKTTFWISGSDTMLYSETDSELSDFLNLNKAISSKNIELSCSSMINLEDAVSAENVSGGCNDIPLLKKYAGTYKKYSLLNESIIKQELKHLLGKELDHFLKSINLGGPIDLQSCHLCLEGSRKYYNEAGIGCVDLSSFQSGRTDNLMSAAIRSDKKIIIFSDTHEYSSLPFPIRKWISAELSLISDKTSPFIDKPRNVVFFNSQ